MADERMTICRTCTERNGEMFEVLRDGARRCPYCGRFAARVNLEPREADDGSVYFEEADDATNS